MFLIGTASSIIIQLGRRSLRSAICAFMRYSRASSPWLYAIPYMFGHIGQSLMLKYILNPFLGNLHIVVDPCGIPLSYGGAIAAYKCRNRWYCHKCLILSYPFFDGYEPLSSFVFNTLRRKKAYCHTVTPPPLSLWGRPPPYDSMTVWIFYTNTPYFTG